MSTKTTFKRIALVAVSALGFGLLSSVAPATAGGDPTFSVDTTSVTVYTDSANSANETSASSKAFALIKISTADADAPRPLATNETITASVVAVPTSVSAKTLSANKTDLAFVELKYSASATGNTGGSPNLYDLDTAGLGKNLAYTTRNSANSADVSVLAGAAASDTRFDGVIGSRNTAVSDSGTVRLNSTTYSNRTYLLAVHGFSQAWDQGEYTIRLSMTDSANFTTKTQDIKVKFVTSRSSAGAAITISRSGTIVENQVYSCVSTTVSCLRATLTNGTTGGRLYEASSTAWLYSVPTLSVAAVDQDGAVEVASGGSLLIGDTGTAGIDTFSTAPTGETETGTLNRVESAYNDGVFGITTNDTATWGPLVTNDATSGNSSSIRVRYGSTEATLVVAVTKARAAVTTSSSVSLTATGAKNHSDSANTLLMDNGNRWTVPLTTKSAVLRVRAMSTSTAVVADYPMVFTTSWSSVSEGEVTPRTGSTYATTVRTDSNGYASITLTNNSPVDGASVVVTVSGFTGTAAGQTILWQKSKAAQVVSSPSADFKAKTGSTNTLTWTFTDTFGVPVADAVIDLKIAGANSATSTVVIPSTTTNSKGEASYTFTDTAGVEASTTLGTTTITATSREVSSVTSARKITWVATVPVIATLTGYFNDNEATSGAGSYSDPVPTTVMYDTATTGAKYLINTSRNLTRSMFLAGEQTDQVAFQYTAKDSAGALVSGVPVTVTTTDGLWILNSIGLPVASRTIYPSSGGVVEFIVMATKTGTHTLTLTAGSVSSTASLIYGNEKTDARYVSLSANASGTANAEKLPSITATVTDRWGNPVSGVTLNVVHTGVGRLAGGAKTTSYTTDSDGAYVIEASSTEAGTATVKVTGSLSSGTSQLLDPAGYVGTTLLVDAITAGVESATGTFTFGAGVSASQAAADAAADAAAEAIDAANAATDAANLAAEAADAATVAAEEARDAADAATAAVEELATQVATLMAALKAQITTLANTVAKIAKKVKA